MKKTAFIIMKTSLDVFLNVRNNLNKWRRMSGVLEKDREFMFNNEDTK